MCESWVPYAKATKTLKYILVRPIVVSSKKIEEKNKTALKASYLCSCCFLVMKPSLAVASQGHLQSGGIRK